MTLASALQIARRRIAVTCLTAAAAILPIVCAMSVWVVDAHSGLSDDQARTMALGDCKYHVRLEGAVRPERAATVEQELRQQGLDPIRVVSRPNMPVDVGGRDALVPAVAGPWTNEFRDSYHGQSGRPPATIDEISVTPALAARGITVGSQVKVGSRTRTVVGISTRAGWAGRTEAVFLTAFDEGEMTMAETSWLLPHQRPSTSEAQRLKIFVQSRDELHGDRSVLTAHPLLLGGTVFLTSMGLLLCVRGLTGRSIARTARALVGVGADASQAASIEALGAALPATAGTIIGWGIAGLECLVVPPVVAAAHDIERPYPPAPWVPLALLSATFVALAALPAWLNGRWAASSGERRLNPDIRPTAVPRQPVTAIRLGVRSILSRRRRSTLLAGVTAALCLLVINIVTVNTTADQQRLRRESSEGGIRDGAVRVFVRSADAATVASALTGLKGVHTLYHFQTQGQPPALRGNGAQPMCPQPVLIDDEDSFATLFGRPESPGERTVLERGDGLGIRPGCGDTVQLVNGKSGEPVGAKPLHLEPASVEPRAAAQFGAVVLRRAAPAYLPDVAPLAVIGELPDDTPSHREELLRRLAGAGISSDAVAFGGVAHEPPPLIVLFVVGESVLLLLALAVVSALTVASEERPTQRALSAIGMGARAREGVQLAAFALPLMAGLLGGTLAGILLSGGFAALAMHAEPVWSPLIWAPWGTTLVLPLLSRTTTPRG